MIPIHFVVFFAGICFAADNFESTDTNVVSLVERILSNDELKCVARVVCEQAAGGHPSTPGQYRQFQVDTSSLFSLLEYIGVHSGGSASPMVEVGRAIMTGLSHRGDPYPCYQQYPSCPKDQARLLYYLNNHRGGFFRGFSRPYYGKEGQSRIINKVPGSNAIESLPDFGGPSEYVFQSDSNFIFPTRNGKKLQLNSGTDFVNLVQEANFPIREGKFFFEPAPGNDRLPAKFSFPARGDSFVNYDDRRQSFFPVN